MTAHYIDPCDCCDYISIAVEALTSLEDHLQERDSSDIDSECVELLTKAERYMTLLLSEFRNAPNYPLKRAADPESPTSNFKLDESDHEVRVQAAKDAADLIRYAGVDDSITELARFLMGDM